MALRLTLPVSAILCMASMIPGGVTAVRIDANLPGTPISGATCRPAAAIPAAAPTIIPRESPIAPPTPTPGFDREAVVDPLLDGMIAAAAVNLAACWNASDWQAVATMVTTRFLETGLGITGATSEERAQGLAALDPGPLRIESMGPVGIWSDGRGVFDLLYFRGRGNPAQAIAARWFFVAEGGVVRFDEESLLLPPPLGDRLAIGFTIADDTQPMQWAGQTGGHISSSPVVALHGVNHGRAAHTMILRGDYGQTLGVLTLPAGSEGDFILLDLPEGTYRIHDPAVEGSTLELVVRRGDG